MIQSGLFFVCQNQFLDVPAMIFLIAENAFVKTYSYSQ